MKLYLLSIGIAGLLGSCQKNASSEKIAFTNASVKPIFEAKCASCHSASGSNSGVWLYDASDYNSSIKSPISKLYRSVYTDKSMPRGTSLSASELQAFKTWYDAGYPAN